ncbi:MAG: hypothetical protein WB586_25420 [Chthoniobacterales bacterium]
MSNQSNMFHEPGKADSGSSIPEARIVAIYQFAEGGTESVSEVAV